jgi:hypothetical protein
LTSFGGATLHQHQCAQACGVHVVGAGEIDNQSALAFRHRFQEFECSRTESNSGVEAQSFGR